jgi:hypothetical protein
MNVGDNGNPALQRSTPFYKTSLIRVIMSQKASAGRIRVVTESHMTPDNIRKRLDILSNAGKPEPRQKSLTFFGPDLGFLPITGIREVFAEVR